MVKAMYPSQTVKGQWAKKENTENLSAGRANGKIIKRVD
jgi:hypothetical protein